MPPLPSAVAGVGTPDGSGTTPDEISFRNEEEAIDPAYLECIAAAIEKADAAALQALAAASCLRPRPGDRIEAPGAMDTAPTRAMEG